MRDLVGTLILLGALQGVVLAPILWARRRNRLANQILAALVGAVALMLILAELGARLGFAGHPHLLGLGSPLPFLFSPLLYLYVVALTRPVTRLDPRWLAHALPFVADAVFMTLAFYTKSAEEKVSLALLSNTAAAPASLQIVNLLEVVQALVYAFLGWQALARYGRKMEGYFSDLARIDLKWLRALVLTHVAVWCVVLVTTALRALAMNTGGLGGLVRLASSFAIFLTGYVSLWQPELVQKAIAAKVAEPEAAPTPPSASPSPSPSRSGSSPPSGSPPSPSAAKYQRNRLDDAEVKEALDKLEMLMTEKHLYREPGLTLSMLADQVGVTPHMLSQILNLRIGKTFFGYVNAHRSEALKAALVDPSTSGRGVLELAFEVGFSSKSTLNSSFKKHTGMTPTEFRTRHTRPKSATESRG